MASERFSKSLNIRNRQAGFNYELLEKFIAGVVLTGTEIKSVREGKVNMTDGYCFVKDSEVFVQGINISPYADASFQNHEPARLRKLLLSRPEINKLEKASREKGLTIVPTRMFINDRGFAKVEIAIARGKKTHDKREQIKERDIQRDLQKWKK